MPTVPPPQPARRIVPVWWPLAAAMLVALVGFQLVFGLRLVGAGDAYWSNPHGDMGQMLAGELAGLRAPWSLPILTPDTLIAPDRVSLVYTDSIPWLTALLKLAHLGRTISLLGVFLLLAWLAQPAAMYALLRASGVRRHSTLLAGALLALLVPAWLARQIGHIALSGHALQLASLALAVHVIRTGLTTRRAAVFVLLGVGAVGVHAYHVPAVTLMLAAALASEALQRRPGALARGVATGTAYLAGVIGAAWATGYLVGRGASGGVDALGLYEMNMVAPVLPQASALAGQKWNGGWFTYGFDPTGGQIYEGFNYQGAGVLLLWVAAAALLWRARRAAASTDGVPTPAPAADRTSALRRWGPLAAALGLMTLYSLGTNPYLGTIHLFAVPLPRESWMEPLTLFRCHGRFFWLVGYALLAGALTVLDRAARPRTGGLLLAAAVALQAADMSQMLYGLHDRFSRPEPLRAPPELLAPAFHGRDYRFYPGFFCTASWFNQLIVRQVSLIAQRQGASTNSAETARGPVDACTRPVPPEARRDAAPGDRRITVLTSEDGQPSAVTDLFKARGDCVSLAGYWMCGRGLTGLAGATPVAGRDLAHAQSVDAVVPLASPAFRAFLASGWSKPEPNGVWSDGTRAVLRLPTPALSDNAVLNVTLEALSYQPPHHAPQRVEVSVRGQPVARWRLDGGGYRSQRAMIPRGLLTPGAPLELTLDLPDALSPNAVLPGSGDPRRLGIGIRRITLAH